MQTGDRVRLVLIHEVDMQNPFEISIIEKNGTVFPITNEKE